VRKLVRSIKKTVRGEMARVIVACDCNGALPVAIGW
jgi:hypothetical protein